MKSWACSSEWMIPCSPNYRTEGAPYTWTIWDLPTEACDWPNTEHVNNWNQSGTSLEVIVFYAQRRRTLVSLEVTLERYTWGWGYAPLSMLPMVAMTGNGEARGSRNGWQKDRRRKRDRRGQPLVFTDFSGPPSHDLYSLGVPRNVFTGTPWKFSFSFGILS